VSYLQLEGALEDHADGRGPLSREEARKLVEELRRLRRVEEDRDSARDEVRRLKEELRRYKSTLHLLAPDDKTAEPWGAPTSRVFHRRRVREDPPRPAGGQPGHTGRARPRPVPNSPPLRLALETCADCGTKLGGPFEGRKRTLTDLPPHELMVFEVEIPRYRCPGCHHRVEPVDPFPPHQQFGFGLLSRAIHLRMLGLSVAKVVDCLEEAHGVHVSPAAVLKMENWAAESLGPLYEGLKQPVRAAPAVHADETSFRIKGENGWLWVFVHLTAVIYRIHSSRGQEVVREVLDGFEGTLVRDAWDPYNCVTTADHQLDLLHINRWVERAEVMHRLEPRPLLKEVAWKLTSAGHPPDEFLEFANRLRGLLRTMVLWSESHPNASRRERRRIHTSARRALAHRVLHPWRDRDAARISKELWAKRTMVFTFLRKPEVVWHNNLAENHVRQGVLYRKISGGRRSWRGAWVLERRMSIYRTCRIRGLKFVEVVRDALRGRGYPAFGAGAG
jgi:transposase